MIDGNRAEMLLATIGVKHGMVTKKTTISRL